MSTQTIETFFTGKTLVIPSYQRDYAWKVSTVTAADGFSRRDDHAA